LGGPLAAIYVVSANFKEMNLQGLEAFSIKIGLLLTIVLLLILFYLPEHIPTSLVWIGYSLCVYLFVQKIQVASISDTPYINAPLKYVCVVTIFGIVLSNLILTIVKAFL
jgi:hypothetical protein